MISTKGRYALRVMIDLAQHKDEEYVPLNEIAIRQEISEKYLEIVLKILVKKKLLKGRRGKGGGYQLTREPSEYTIGEILELAEGNLATVACLVPGAEVCSREEQCIYVFLCGKKFDGMVHDFFYGITLEDVLNGNYLRRFL